MAGTGGSIFRRYSPDDLRNIIESTQESTDQIQRDATVNRLLTDLLAQYNQRDVELTRSRLEEIKTTLRDVLETTVDMRFGGSTAKHTYVDGLSDVDALAILRDPTDGNDNPSNVLANFAAALKQKLQYDINVHEGGLAVTVTYPDGMELQILPAIKTATGVRLPGAPSDNWSKVIRPHVFARKLTERNEACHGRLVPVIKLAKAALANLPGTYRPSGYHIESMAVSAFARYTGPSNYKAMLHHFFDQSSGLVSRPIQDSTGQSLNVDENLGPRNSIPRRLLSGYMSRVARRMSNADRVGSSEAWLATIGE